MNRLTPSENTALGMVAGTEVLLVVQPMIFWKNLAQQGLEFTANPRAVYRGLAVSAGSQSLVAGSQFLITGQIKHALTGDASRRLSDMETVGAALFGGAVSGLVCSPMELVMIQQQRHGGSMLATVLRLVKEQGMGSMSRGIVPTVVREGVYCCGYLGIAPTISRMVEEMSTGAKNTSESSGGATARLVGAVVGGLFAGVASHPFDTVKTCMQGDIERRQHGNMRSVAAVLGRRSLYLGVAQRSCVIVTATLLINIFKDYSAPLMFPSKF